MQPIRKPRVFLSHSKKDIDFIRRLEADLRGTQCEPWIDEIELRAGQPWLDQIFGAGIPSCEIVLCYFTVNSADSAVFMQELDARLIERLNSSRVALLLYVSSSDLRSRLRLDLQRLQSPELNEQNYASAFPRLVAEIWRSYAESLAHTSVESERVKRLEAELRIKELEGEASASVFTASEHAEFKAIWFRIDRSLPMNVAVKLKTRASSEGKVESGKIQQLPDVVKDHSILLDAGILYRATVITEKYQPSSYALHDRIKEDIVAQLSLDPTACEVSFELPFDLEAELLRFGFLQRQYSPPPSNGDEFRRFIIHRPIELIFTSKFDRFGFWIDYNFGPLPAASTAVRG
jgi:hypothetical protein